MDVIDPSGGVVQVNSGLVPLRKEAHARRREGVAQVVTSLPRRLPGFRIRSVFIGGGDYLVVAGSTSQISAQSRHLALDRSRSTGLLVALVMMVLARLVMRKDLQHDGAPDRLRE